MHKVSTKKKSPSRNNVIFWHSPFALSFLHCFTILNTDTIMCVCVIFVVVIFVRKKCGLKQIGLRFIEMVRLMKSAIIFTSWSKRCDKNNFALQFDFAQIGCHCDIFFMYFFFHFSFYVRALHICKFPLDNDECIFCARFKIY